METKNFRLGSAILSLKVLVTCCVIALGVAYSVSLLQINNRSHFKEEDSIRHYRGDGEEGLMPPQSDTAMISVAHVHTFSQPAVLAMMGLMLVFTGLSEGGKVFWIVLSFAGSLAKNVSPWLIRDVSPAFLYMMYTGGGAMFLSFGVMAGAVLWETWWKRV